MDATTELFPAIRAGDLAAVQRLLDAEPSLVQARGGQGESAILTAVYHRQQAIVRLLIDRGVDLDLFEAAATGDLVALARHLAADPTIVGRFSADGWTPLHLAAFFGHAKAVELLLAYGASPAAVSTNATGNTPLHAALAGGHTLVAGLLVGAGADVDASSAGGWRPLHVAVTGGHLDAVKVLVAQAADVNAANDAGQTPLAVATQKNQKAIVEFLLRQGALA
ncbi:MAG TPA: ankyrin repeat domain-containing protein [Vicinamibacterales bacterium]|nr:ankyrin repeat domain-containing protein [Vicinamibacterales bacterium]